MTRPQREPGSPAATKNRPFAAGIAGLPSRFRPGAAAGVRIRVHVATIGREPGNWLVAVDRNVCRVLLGSIPEPDARLFADSDIGHSILSGCLPIDEAVAGRLLHYEGDREELRRFGACFQFGDAP